MALARSVAFHYAAASKGRLIRCTVLGSTPNRTAILRTLSPVSLRAFRAAEMLLINLPGSRPTSTFVAHRRRQFRCDAVVE
jgi:hypothetical protein